MKITRISDYSGITRTIDLPITIPQLAAYVGGTKIQDAFPNLSADDREFFKTGIIQSEWDEMMSEPDPVPYDIQ